MIEDNKKEISWFTLFGCVMLQKEAHFFWHSPKNSEIGFRNLKLS